MKSIFWVFCRMCVCARACFMLLSPGQLGYLCHITSFLIRAQQKGPVSAHLTMWSRDGWMEKFTFHPHKHLSLSPWLAVNKPVREAGEAQHVCVRHRIQQGETDTNRERSTWRERPSQQSLKQPLKVGLTEFWVFLNQPTNTLQTYHSVSSYSCLLTALSWKVIALEL